MPEMLEDVLSNMNDVSRYCRVSAMEYDEAMDCLERGEVTAILVLPEGFVQGVMDGSNPDLELIVSSDRPLESLLTLWIGQSASDLLTSVQTGIYTVLEIYQQNPPENLSYNDVVLRINMRYVNWTLNRQDMFRLSTIDLTGQLPVEIHYGLSILCFLALSTAPLFTAVYDRKWITAQRRFLAVGRGMLHGWFASFSACWLVMFLLLTAGQLLICGGNPAVMIGCGALCALFCAAFISLCCLVTSGMGSCGVFTFACTLVMLFLSGGILPAVLLPATLHSCLDASPITWMRSVLALSLEDQEPRSGMIAGLVIAAAAMAAAGAALYRRRGMQEERI